MKMNNHKAKTAEYYGFQEVQDRLYADSKENKIFTNLMESIMSDQNIKLAYRNVKSNTGSQTAGYTRVSSGKEAMLHSLSAQVSYYSELIQNNPEFIIDEAITGTNDSRAEFQRMIEDCKAGKIDMIITKSISRFARNTVTMLQIVRELKAMGVDVYFEKENILVGSPESR